MKQFFGVLMLLMGAGLACWLVYARLSGQAKDQSPLAGIGLCLGLFIVGIRWARGSTFSPTSGSNPRDTSPRQVAPSPSRGLDINLSNLTPPGWGLLLTTFGFVLAEAICLVLWVPDVGNLMKDGLGATLIGLAGLGLAIAFFQLGKIMLAWLGLPVYRQS